MAIRVTIKVYNNSQGTVVSEPAMKPYSNFQYLTSESGVEYLQVKLTATPKSGYEFVRWELTNCNFVAGWSSTTNPTKVYMRYNHDTYVSTGEVRVVYKVKPTPPQPSNVKLIVNPSGGSVLGSWIVGGEPHDETFNGARTVSILQRDLPASVKVKATPPSGKIFQSWSFTRGSASATYFDNPLSFNVPKDSSDVSVVANYSTPSSSPTYNIAIQVSPSGAGTASGAGSYTQGTNYSLSATPYEGYQFDGWYFVDNTFVSSDNPFKGSMPAGNLAFIAKFASLKNSVQSSSYYSDNSWRDGFITTWTGIPERTNTLRCKIIGTNGSDLTGQLGSLYKFYYNATGYLNDSQNPVKVNWVLVFQPANAQGNPNPIRNDKYIHSYLRVYSKNEYQYGLDQASSDPYTTSAPVQFKSNGTLGTINGKDIIEPMSSPKNNNSWCQTTCSGSIPYSEIDDNKKLHVEFSRVSFGMLTQSSNAVWYNSNFGAGLTKDASSAMALYKSVNATNVSDNDLVAPKAGVSEIISYHQQSVSISGNDCYLLNPSTGAWHKNTLTVDEITQDIIENGKVSILSNYWVGKDSSNNYYSTCNAFYNNAEIPVQFAPQNINCQFEQTGVDTATLTFKKHIPQGSNGYFNKLKIKFSDSEIYECVENFYDSDQIFSLQYSASTGDQLVTIYHDQLEPYSCVVDSSSFSFEIIPVCVDSFGNEYEGNSLSYNFSYSGLQIIDATIVYPYVGKEDIPNCVLYKNAQGRVVNNICFSVGFRISQDEISNLGQYFVKLEHINGSYSQFFTLSSVDLTNKFFKITSADITENRTFRFSVWKNGELQNYYNLTLNPVVKEYVDYSGLISDKVVAKNLVDKLLLQAMSQARNYTWLYDTFSEDYEEYFELPIGLLDLNGDGWVDFQDSTLLLYHTYFPDDDEYKIPGNQPVDYNNDGQVTSDDAMLLANYISGLDIDLNVVGTDKLVKTRIYREVLSYIKKIYFCMKEAVGDRFICIDESSYQFPAEDLYPATDLYPGANVTTHTETCLKNDYIQSFSEESGIVDNTYHTNSTILNNTLSDQVVRLIQGNQYSLEAEETSDQLIIVDDYPDGTISTLEVENNYQKAILYMITNMI